MNVMLTDVSSPTTVMPKAETTSDASHKGFRLMMQKNLQPESKSDLQLVENKEIDTTLETSAVKAELPIDSSLIPDFWIEHLATSDTELTTEQSPQAGIGVVEVEASSIVVKPILSEIRSKENRSTIGDTLPVNGNPLPSTILPSVIMEQPRSADPMQNIWVKTLQQEQAGEQKNLIQNMTAGLNTRAVGTDSAQLDTNSQSVTNGLPDQLDQFSTKFLESTVLQQNASDSSSTRLQSAMSAINGLHNLSANPATANPVASSLVLSNSLERMVMTNSDSSAEWSNGIGERVSLMLNQKQNAATIRLDPPMLGKMDIQIQVRDDVTNVTISTQHAQTRDMVDSASYRLREFLQDAGYQNVNVDVSHQSDQQKNDAQFMSDAESDTTNGSDSDQLINGDNSSLSAQMSHSDSLVDYFA